MRILIEPPRNTRPDPAVAGGTLAHRVLLSPNVTHVKAGTPLRASALGWEADRDGGHTVLFAAAGGYGGALVPVYREVVLDVMSKYLVPGARYKIGEIDPTGYVTFEPDPEGPYTALTDQTILLTPDQ